MYRALRLRLAASKSSYNHSWEQKNMTKMIRFVAFLIAVSLSLSSKATPLINGVAIHSELGQESFIGALFTTTFSSSAKEILVAQEEKQLQVRILANRLSSRRFKRMWIEGLAINASASELENQAKNMAEFSNMLKVTLVRGDIFAVQRSNDSVKVSINGSSLGEIEDVGFFDLLLRTWIGPVPLSSTFRRALLSGGNTEGALVDRFNSINPSDERITAVAKALTAQREKEKENKKSVAIAAVPDITPDIATPKIDTAPSIKPPVIVQQPSIPSASEPAEDSSTPVSSTEPAELTAPKPAEGQDVALATTPDAQEPTEAAPITDSIIEDDAEKFTAESLLSQQLYIAKLKKWTQRKIRYPQRSLEKNEQGTVRLNVTIDREGSLVKVDVTEEPKYGRLTKAAKKAVEKSQPYPAMPEDLNGENFEFSLPIVFRLLNE